MRRGGLILPGRGRMSPFPGIPVHSRAVHPGLAVLRSAEGWFDAKDLTSGAQQSLPNRADGGATVAQFGSTTGADSSDPARLPFTGEKYVDFLGGLQQMASSVSGVTDNLLEWRVDLDIPGAPTGGQQRFLEGSLGATFIATGEVSVFVRNTVPGFTSVNVGGAVLGVLPAGRRQFRCTVDCAAGVFTLYHRAPGADLLDNSGWTLHGSTTAAAFTPNITGTYRVGGQVAGVAAVAGAYWRSVVYAAGVPVVDWYPDRDLSSGSVTWTSSTVGGSFTHNRDTSGLLTTVVTRPVIVTDGTDDHLVLPTSLLPSHVTTTTGAFTLVVLSRTWPNASTTSALFGSGNGTFEGLCLYESGGVQLATTARDSGTGLVTSAINSVGGSGALKVKGMLVDNGTMVTFATGHTTPTPVSMAGLIDINFGTTPKVSSSFGNASTGSGRAGEYFSVASWNRALSPAERAAVSAYLEAGAYA